MMDLQEQKWTTCCRDKGRKCPQIRIAGDRIWIRDDDGCVVVMTLEQLGDVAITASELTRGK